MFYILSITGHKANVKQKGEKMDEKTQIITEDDFYPVALPTAKSPPPFPIGALPPTILDMVNFVSETTQVYPDMPASVALAALSVCLQGKAKVSFSPYWSEELNLYMLIIAPPGERKSAVFSAMTAPINKFVNEYNALHLIDVQTYFNYMLRYRKERSKCQENFPK